MRHDDLLDNFDEFVWTYEVDFLGAEGLASKKEISELYQDWLKQRAERGDRSDAAKTAAKTRAENAKKGISQKNLTGSTKQKRWASEIRGKMISGFSDDNQKILLSSTMHSKFWIVNRNTDPRALNSRMEVLVSERAKAHALYRLEQRKQAEAGEDPVYNPSDAVTSAHEAYAEAHAALWAFLEPEE